MGDVYAVPPHTGRGGWTWYTGSAGWMYRSAVEYILGFKLAGDHLRIDPCIPRGWREFEITYRRGGTTYRIKVENPHALNHGVMSLEIDGARQANDELILTADGQTHDVRVVMGEKPAAAGTEAQRPEIAQPEETRERNFS
jgi:cyclic beta-1,2-glucan synthetase